MHGVSSGPGKMFWKLGGAAYQHSVCLVAPFHHILQDAVISSGKHWRQYDSWAAGRYKTLRNTCFQKHFKNAKSHRGGCSGYTTDSDLRVHGSKISRHFLILNSSQSHSHEGISTRPAHLRRHCTLAKQDRGLGDIVSDPISKTLICTVKVTI